MKLKSRLMTIGKVLFAVGLIYWLIATKKLNLEDIKPFLSWEGIIFGVLFIGANLTILSERWRYLIKSHVETAKLWPTWKLNVMGIFFNFAMPGGIGGDVIKAYYLQKDIGTSRTVAFSSALVDRALGLYTAILMAFVALFYEYFIIHDPSPLLKGLLIWVSLGFAGLNCGILLLKYWKWPESLNHAPGIVGKLFKFMQTCRTYLKNPRHILLAIVLTVVGQFFTIMFFGWALRSILGESIEWSTLFFIVPVGFMVMAIPLTPAGVGVGQAAFYFLFQNFSQINTQSGPAVITAFQFMQFLWGLLGAYFYLTRRSELLETAHIQKSHL